jgi:hypothetical protein
MKLVVNILFGFLVLQLMFVSNIQAQNKKALIVAISDYAPGTDWRKINAVNDVSIIKSAITKQGFKDENILVLTNDKATKSEIISTFRKQLINGLEKGDIAYFHFSGHGQQVQDINGDEIDGYDESIVPYDGHAKFKKGVYEGQNHLLDDELNVLYSELRKKLGPEGHFLCTIDACHSGTSTRGLGVARGTDDLMASSDFVSQNLSKEKEFGQFGSASKDESEMSGMVALFGALAQQLNYELKGEDGKSYGSLSYAFSKALSELEPESSYRALFERIRLMMVNTSSKQSPESEGELDQAIFGGSFLGKPNYYVVKKKKRDGRLVLSSGFLHGLRKGSVVGFYPAETRDISSVDILTSGVITTSLASEATVTLDSLVEGVDLEHSWIFMLEESFGDLSYTVNVDENINHSEYLKQEIYKLAFIKKADQAGDLNLVSNGSNIDFKTPGNIEISTVAQNVDSIALFASVKKILIEYGQAEYIRKLEQSSKSIAIDFEFVPIDFDVEEFEETARFPISDKMDYNRTIRFNEDDIVKLIVRNKGTQDAFFTVIDIQPNNEINVVFPKDRESPASYSVKAGETFEVPHPILFGPPFGQELYKLIASKEPIDLRPIASTRGVSTRGSQPDDPFEKLFSLSYIDEEVQSRGSRTLSLPKGKVNIFSQPFVLEEFTDGQSLSEIEASQNEGFSSDINSEELLNEEEGVFAYATKPSVGNAEAEESSQLEFRKSVVQKVLDDLINAKGELGRQRPKLVMKNQERYVAWMNAPKVEIGFENLAYEVCRSFGADSLNAIAALLGHELTHYYDRHDWSRHFVKENRELRTGQKIAALKEGLKNETQADYLGGFLGYSAGYNTLGIMPKVLSSLYEAYELPPELPGYPSLNDRAEIAKKSIDKLEVLASIFDMSSYLTIVGDYSNAELYYKHILKDFQSREIYNNLGVVNILAVRQIMVKNPYTLPLLLDGESRAKPRSRGEASEIGGGGLYEILRESLREAISYFKIACQLDPAYPVARLNMACAYILLEEYEEAEYHIRKASRLFDESEDKNLLNTVSVLEGIIAAEQQDKNLAKQRFEQAISAGSQIAKNNLDILLNNADQFQNFVSQETVDQSEFIDDLDLSEIVGNIEVDNFVELTNEISLNIKKLDSSNLFIHYDQANEEYIYVQITKKNYEGKTTKGIGLLDNRELVEKAYGEDGRVLQVVDAVFVSYDKHGVIFQYDDNDELKSWAVFLK